MKLKAADEGLSKHGWRVSLLGLETTAKFSADADSFSGVFIVSFYELSGNVLHPPLTCWGLGESSGN